MNLLGAMEGLRRFHLDWAWVVIVGNGLAGVWALAAHRYPKARHPALWWFTGAAEVAVFVQVIVGVILIQDHPDKAPFQFHMLYGFSAGFAVAIIYSYRNQLKGNLYLLYGGGGLFLMGLGLRALEVGPR